MSVLAHIGEKTPASADSEQSCPPRTVPGQSLYSDQQSVPQQHNRVQNASWLGHTPAISRHSLRSWRRQRQRRRGRQPHRFGRPHRWIQGAASSQNPSAVCLYRPRCMKQAQRYHSHVKIHPSEPDSRVLAIAQSIAIHATRSCPRSSVLPLPAQTT